MNKAELHIKLNSLTVGEATSNMGFKLPRDQMSPENAVAMFCSSRLDVNIALDDEQMKLAGMEEKPIAGIVDVKGVKFTAKWISASFVFNNESNKAGQLSRFVKRDVLLKAERIGDNEDDESDDE